MSSIAFSTSELLPLPKSPSVKLTRSKKTCWQSNCSNRMHKRFETSNQAISTLYFLWSVAFGPCSRAYRPGSWSHTSAFSSRSQALRNFTIIRVSVETRSRRIRFGSVWQSNAKLSHSKWLWMISRVKSQLICQISCKLISKIPIWLCLAIYRKQIHLCSHWMRHQKNKEYRN